MKTKPITNYLHRSALPGLDQPQHRVINQALANYKPLLLEDN